MGLFSSSAKTSSTSDQEEQNISAASYGEGSTDTNALTVDFGSGNFMNDGAQKIINVERIEDDIFSDALTQSRLMFESSIGTFQDVLGLADRSLDLTAESAQAGLDGGAAAIDKVQAAYMTGHEKLNLNILIPAGLALVGVLLWKR